MIGFGVFWFVLVVLVLFLSGFAGSPQAAENTIKTLNKRAAKRNGR